MWSLRYNHPVGATDAFCRDKLTVWASWDEAIAAHEHCWIKPIEQLVLVRFTHCCASTSSLSTWWSSTALIGIPGFEGGFPLRCFQRLSFPHLATLLCCWRNNRSTRGASIPVLSY